MRPFSIVKLTFYENVTGQILWIAGGVGLIILAMIGFVSDVALTHQARMLDVSTYFLVDLVIFATAALLGSSVYSRDFSSRGLAEIAIPAGVSRATLLFWRWLAHAVCLVIVLALLLSFRHLAFWLSGISPEHAFQTTCLMALFSALKAGLALAVAVCFGCVTRPVLALLATVALFLFGHFASGISSSQGLISGQADLVSPQTQLLFKLLRSWNPNYLVLDSLRGQWESPTWNELASRASWGATAMLSFVFFAMFLVRKKDVGALQL